MKIQKDEIQKIVLAGIILAFVLYVYSSMMLGALDSHESGANHDIADLQPKVMAAKKQIAATRGLEQNAPQVSEQLYEIKSLIPDGAPIAWFPPQMKDFLSRQGITKSSIKLNSENSVPDLPGYKVLNWTIDVSQVDFVSLGIAVSALENQFPLTHVASLQVDAGADSPGAQHAVLSINTIVNQ
ncbi:MAG: hypothetical protein QM796_14280 [Chthoniobacteraceae bacterium]